MIDFARFLYIIPKTAEKKSEKVEKKVFLTVYPGLKSEFLRPKTLFMHLRTG